jgi:hypothetical protein
LRRLCASGRPVVCDSANAGHYCGLYVRRAAGRGNWRASSGTAARTVSDLAFDVERRRGKAASHDECWLRAARARGSGGNRGGRSGRRYFRPTAQGPAASGPGARCRSQATYVFDGGILESDPGPLSSDQGGRRRDTAVGGRLS